MGLFHNEGACTDFGSRTGLAVAELLGTSQVGFDHVLGDLLRVGQQALDIEGVGKFFSQNGFKQSVHELLAAMAVFGLHGGCDFLEGFPGDYLIIRRHFFIKNMVDLDVESPPGKQCFFYVLVVHRHGQGGEDVDEDIQFAWGKTIFKGYGLYLMVLEQRRNSL